MSTKKRELDWNEINSIFCSHQGEEDRGGAVLIYLPWQPFSLQSFLLFLPKVRGGGGGSPLRSTTALAFQRL